MASVTRPGRRRVAFGGTKTRSPPSLTPVKVRDPHGQTWRVTRRWVPWRIRRRWTDPDLELFLDGGLAGFLAVLVIGLIIWPLFGFLVVLVLEAFLLLVLLPFAILGRMWFGQHWWVEAREGFTPRWETQAGTWHEAGALIRRTAESIQHGDGPLANLGEDADLSA